MKVFVVQGVDGYLCGLYRHHEDAVLAREELLQEGILTEPVHARRVHESFVSDDELDKLEF